MDERPYVGDKVIILDGCFTGVKGYVTEITTDLQIIETVDGKVVSVSPTDIILTIQVDKINTILVPLRLVKKVEGVYDKN